MNTCTKWPQTMNSQRRNLTKPVEEAGGTLLGTSWNALLPGNSPESGAGVQTRNMHTGKCNCIYRWCVRRIPEEPTNSGCGNRSRGCLQQSPVQAVDGYAHAVWGLPNTDPVDCRSASGKNSCYAAWKLDLCSSSAHNGPTTRITALGDPLQCLRQRPSRSEAKWTQQDSYRDRRRVHIQNIKGLPGGRWRNATTTGCESRWCHDTGSLINPDKAQTLWWTLNNRAVKFDGAVVERTSHMRYLVIHFVIMLPTENTWKQQHWSTRKVC